MTYQEQLQKQQEEYEKKLNNLFSLQPVPAKDTISLSSLSKQKQKYLKNISLQSYLQSKKLRKVFSPFSDTDKDTFANIFDCYPFDPNRHGIGDWLRGIGRRIGIIKPKPKPTPKTPYEKSKLAKDIGYKPPSSPLHKTLKEAEKKTISRGGGGRAVSPPSPKVDISQPPAGYSKGAWENIKKLLGEEAARRIKLGKAHGVKFEYDEKGRIKKIIRPTATGTKTSYVVYDKAGGREVSKEEYKKITAKPAPQDKKKDKLRLGAAVVSAYTKLVELMKKTPTPQERLAKSKAMKRGIEWIKTHPTPLEFVSKKLAKTEIAKRVSPHLLKLREKGEKALFYLEKSRRAISEGLRPIEKEKRLALEKSDKIYSENVRKYNKEIKKFEKEVKEFSNKYLGRELSTKEYNIAVKEQERLKRKADVLEATRIELENYEAKRKEIERQFDIKIKAVPKIQKWAQSMWVGALSAPIAAAELGIGLAVKPEETLVGAFKGIGQLPETIAKRPIETITELGVTSAIYSAALRGIGNAVSKARVMKVKPKISQSFSIGRAVKVGKTPSGLNLWKVEGKIITKLKHPKTGKTIETFETQTFSDIITAPTKAGAIKAYSQTFAISLKRGNIGIVLGKVPKVKIKAGLTKAKGEITLSPTQVEKLFRGRGKFGIREIGKMEIKYPITKASKRIATKTKIKLGKEFEAMTDVWAKELGVRGRVDIAKLYKKPSIIKGAAIKGKEYTYSYKALTDIYGKEGAKLIMRAREKGITRAYVPEERVLFLKDFKVKPIKLKAKFPKYKRIVDIYGKPIKPTKPTIQKLLTGMPEEAVAKISAETTIKSIGKIFGRKVKSITVPKTITKVTSSLRAIQFISPTVVAITTPRLRTELKEREKIEAGLRAGLGIKLGVKYAQALDTRLKQVFRTGQIQAPKLAKPTAKVSITPVAPITPTIPAPKIPPFIYPFETEKLKREKKKRKKAKLKPQPRAYQASVGAVLLGYEVSPEQLKKLKKQIYTGLELRPVIRKEAAKLRKQQFNLLESAIGTAKKGSPRKAVKQLRKQYEENLKKMLSYAHWDKKRSKARRKVKRKQLNPLSVFSLSTIPIKIYNPYRQGESRKSMLRRLQKILV